MDRMMNGLRLSPGDALLHWAMTASEETHWPGVARPMPDRVDYLFRNGWVDTGPLPCREALLQTLPQRQIGRPTGPFDALMIGLDGDELDFSRFCHLPTLISRGFKCAISGKGPARFRISTCGGLRIWLGEDQVAVFEPFTRNQPQTTEICIDLAERPNWLTVRLEDLHERDTTCFFSMILLEGSAVETYLPEEFDAKAVLAAAKVLGSLRTDRLFQDSDSIRLIADVPPDGELDLTILNAAPFSRGGLVADPDVVTMKPFSLSPEKPFADIKLPGGGGTGCIALPIETRIGRARLQRLLGTTILPDGAPLSGTLAERKSQAAQRIALHTGFEPSVAALLASMEKQPDRVAKIVGATLSTIEKRFDCSDFSILPLLRLWRDYRQTLSGEMADRLKQAILGYRYWLDEPGDDVMWFWSENHVLCFHAAQLIAGRLFPETRFPNSGKLGSDHAAQAERRLDRWFASIFEHGLCEWNSAAYYPIDMLGLFTLHDMAPDFRDRASVLLDRIFVMTALHSSGGVPAGTQGRCYEKELLGGPMTELGSVLSVAMGGQFRPGYDRASALFCLSSYSPPDLEHLANPEPSVWLEAKYTQGLGHEGKLSLWKSALGQLSTVHGLKTGERGHQAQVIDVQLSNHPMARLWINHPGELKPWGERRPSLLAGSHVMPRVAQDSGVALAIFDLDRPWTKIGFSQVFAARQAFGPPNLVGDWLVFSGAVAVWCSSALKPVQTGLYRDSLWRAHDAKHAWAVCMRTPDEDEAAFLSRLSRATLSFDSTSLTLRVVDLQPKALELAFEGTFRLDGSEKPFGPLTPVPHVSFNGGAFLPLAKD